MLVYQRVYRAFREFTGRIWPVYPYIVYGHPMTVGKRYAMKHV